VASNAKRVICPRNRKGNPSLELNLLSIDALNPQSELSFNKGSDLPTAYALLTSIESVLSVYLEEKESNASISLFDLYHSSVLTFSTSDHFHFGECWKNIRLIPKESLFALVQKRREEIFLQKEYWKEKIQPSDGKLEYYLIKGSLVPSDEGAGAAYFLWDEDDHPRFVIKPCDEEIYCLNNRKGYGSPFSDVEHRVCEDIPLYQSAQTDFLAYKVAQLIGCSAITAKTTLSLIFSDSFHDCYDTLTAEEKKNFPAQPVKEKLCSVQEYLEDTHSFLEILYKWMNEGKSDEEIMECIDQDDYEDANIFIWTMFDNDAHSANLRTYVKRITPDGKEIYGLKKIDNSLSFPEKNTGLYNFLIALPNSQYTLSERAKKLIADIPIAEITAEMTSLGLEASVPAFLERITLLQSLARQSDLSIEEINYQLKLLGKPHE
jgi:hypothetical protein